MTEALRAPARDRILDAARALVLQRGFAATTVDAVLDAAGTSKGAFFHHFPTKAALGLALVERYARDDAEILERALRTAEARTEDPAGQLVELLRVFEDAVDAAGADGGAVDSALGQPGCLFVSFVYEQVAEGAEIDAVIRGSIALWRTRILERLTRAVALRPPPIEVDLESLADQLFTVFEGSFILARATGDPTKVRAQIAHLRTYLTLLLSPPGA